MSELRCSAQFLIDRLFANVEPKPDIKLRDATYDFRTDTVSLEIEGPEIPNVERIVALFTTHEDTKFTVKFEPY